MSRTTLARIALAALAVAGAAFAYGLSSGTRPPTLEEYLAHVGLDRRSVVAGYRIGEVPTRCGDRPTVLQASLDDVAGAHPGFIIVNPERMAKLPKVVQLYAFAHECGHQLHGRSEEAADCYAVFRGEAQGWLTPEGINAICAFWKPYAGDNVHLPGASRCELMRRCFAGIRHKR